MSELSTGHDATLGGYRTLAAFMFGEESPAVAFLDEKIAKQGADEPVLADEAQMVYALASLHFQGVRAALRAIYS